MKFFYNKTSKNSALTQLCLTIIACAALNWCKTIQAETFQVTTTYDSINPCTLQQCTLRSAIIAANANPNDHDIIILPSGVYQLNIPGRLENMAATGDLDIIGSVTIQGTAASSTIINAQQLDRVFQLFTLSGQVISIEAVTLTGGYSNDGKTLADDGAGLMHIGYGQVFLKDCIIQSNEIPVEADSGDGAGIANINGQMTIERCSIQDNDNFSTNADGGGVANNAGTLIISATNISNNNVMGTNGDGGGVFNMNGSVELINVTVSNNNLTSSNPDGGGIYSQSGQVQLTHVTVAENLISGTNAQGSALASDNSAFIINNSIISGDCNNGFNGTNNNNLESPGNSCGLTTVSSEDLALGPLADNGGSTMTMMPSFNSIAIDSGSDALCEHQDQRGLLRPQDGNSDGTIQCDIGALEVMGIDDLIFKSDFE